MVWEAEAQRRVAHLQAGDERVEVRLQLQVGLGLAGRERGAPGQARESREGRDGTSVEGLAVTSPWGGALCAPCAARAASPDPPP